MIVVSLGEPPKPPQLAQKITEMSAPITRGSFPTINTLAGTNPSKELTRIRTAC